MDVGKKKNKNKKEKEKKKKKCHISEVAGFFTYPNAKSSFFFLFFNFHF